MSIILAGKFIKKVEITPILRYNLFEGFKRGRKMMLVLNQTEFFTTMEGDDTLTFLNTDITLM